MITASLWIATAAIATIFDTIPTAHALNNGVARLPGTAPQLLLKYILTT